MSVDAQVPVAHVTASVQGCEVHVVPPGVRLMSAHRGAANKSKRAFMEYFPFFLTLTLLLSLVQAGPVGSRRLGWGSSGVINADFTACPGASGMCVGDSGLRTCSAATAARNRTGRAGNQSAAGRPAAARSAGAA